MYRKATVQIAAMLAASFIAASSAPAETFVIQPDGSGDFPTIQEGIWACAAGDVVELGDGVFTGNWNRFIDFMGMAVTVRSQSGDPETCIIDVDATVDDQAFGFVFFSGEGPESRLEGVTVRNGFDLGC